MNELIAMTILIIGAIEEHNRMMFPLGSAFDERSFCRKGCLS